MADGDGTAEGATAASVGAYLWKNRAWLLQFLKGFTSWFKKGKGTTKSPGILVLGPGGVGKTTLSRLLSEGSYDLLKIPPGKYKESVRTERVVLSKAPEVEVVVPPGQEPRRPATWAQLHSDLTAGKFKGVILLASYGYLAFSDVGYRRHKLFDNSKKDLVAKICAASRQEELKVLEQLVPHVNTAQGKVWFLTLVTKQDLWWDEKEEVMAHYQGGVYDAEVQKILASKGGQSFRHETVFASLVIGNFCDGDGEVLQKNTAGYDQEKQVESLRKLIETLDALRQWEGAQ